MSNLLYVLGAVGFTAVVSVMLLLKERHPVSVENDVEKFSKGMQALADRRDLEGLGRKHAGRGG